MPPVGTISAENVTGDVLRSLLSGQEFDGRAVSLGGPRLLLIDRNEGVWLVEVKRANVVEHGSLGPG